MTDAPERQELLAAVDDPGPWRVKGDRYLERSTLERIARAIKSKRAVTRQEVQRLPLGSVFHVGKPRARLALSLLRGWDLIEQVDGREWRWVGAE